jgi:hypothetical protein
LFKKNKTNQIRAASPNSEKAALIIVFIIPTTTTNKNAAIKKAPVAQSRNPMLFIYKSGFIYFAHISAKGQLTQSGSALQCLLACSTSKAWYS